jgi:hypothetical protein
LFAVVSRNYLCGTPGFHVAAASAGRHHHRPSLAAVSPSLYQSADQMGIVSSTNPVLSLQPVASLFGQQNSLAQPVSFSLPGN